MKILIVSQYFYPESFRVNALSKELVKRGYEVTVLTGYPQYPYGEIYEGFGFDLPYEKNWNGVNIERLKVVPRGHNIFKMFLNCLTYVTEGNKWVKKCTDKYDLIYVFETSPVTVGLPAVTYKKKFSTPIFFNVQDLWPENVVEVLGIKNKLVIGVINRIVDKIYRNSDKILCSSNGFVKNISKRGVPEAKLVFWPQFCESPDFDRMVKPECYDDNYFNIVFTGNIGYAQGLNLLVDVAENLKDMPIRWYIVGDGRAKEKLIEIVNDKGLNPIVNFINRVSEHEANCYVKFADCAYFSFSDCNLFDLTIPAKLQTYLACGAPILGAVGGESAKIIKTAECGLIADKTVESLSEQTLCMMNLSKEELNKFRLNAMSYFKNNFEMNKVIDDFENLISETID